MFTSTSSTCALALVLMCSSFATAVNLSNICLLLKNNARIASGQSCSSYYICSNGVAKLQYCSPGSYFNKNTQNCVRTPPSYCPESGTNPCSELPIGSFAPVTGSCSKYYYCGRNGAEEGICPNNLVFNPTTQTCDYVSNYPCQDSTGVAKDASTVVNLCLYVQNGIYFGDAFSCSGWQKCNNEISFTTGSCTNGLVFDTENAICNYPSSVDCSQVTRDPSLDVNGAGEGGSCTTLGALKPATACNQFYECNNGIWQLLTCRSAKYYDTISQTCVRRDLAYNDCDRCVDTTLPFVNAFGTDCTGYLYCSNGVSKSSGTCPYGDYFNEDIGGCVSQNPNFVFCSSESSTPTSISPSSTTASEDTTVTVKATVSEDTTVTVKATVAEDTTVPVKATVSTTVSST